MEWKSLKKIITLKLTNLLKVVEEISNKSNNLERTLEISTENTIFLEKLKISIISPNDLITSFKKVIIGK